MDAAAVKAAFEGLAKALEEASAEIAVGELEKWQRQVDSLFQIWKYLLKLEGRKPKTTFQRVWLDEVYREVVERPRQQESTYG